MPGQPRKRALVAALERRARETFEDGDKHPADQATHLDYVCVWVESGRTMLSLMREIEGETGYSFPAAMLGNYLRMTFPDATARLDAARDVGAHAMLDETIDIADDDDDAQRARNRIAVRQYVAGSWNPRTSPKRVEAAASMMTAGAMLLEALRSRASLSTEILSGRVSSPQPELPATIGHALPTQVTSSDNAQRVDMKQLSDIL